MSVDPSQLGSGDPSAGGYDPTTDATNDPSGVQLNTQAGQDPNPEDPMAGAPLWYHVPPLWAQMIMQKLGVGGDQGGDPNSQGADMTGMLPGDGQGSGQDGALPPDGSGSAPGMVDQGAGAGGPNSPAVAPSGPGMMAGAMPGGGGPPPGGGLFGMNAGSAGPGGPPPPGGPPGGAQGGPPFQIPMPPVQQDAMQSMPPPFTAPPPGMPNRNRRQ